MVKYCSFLLAAVLLIPARTSAAQVKASQIIPKPSDIPGSFKYVWEVGGNNRKYKSEAEWRKDNPDPLPALERSAAQMAAIPDAEWQKMTDAARLMLQNASAFSGALLDPGQRKMFEMMAAGASRGEVAQALSETRKNTADAALMEYIMAEKPAALAAENEEDRDPGGIIRLKLSLMTKTRDYTANNITELDVDQQELDAMTTETKKAYDGFLDKMLPTVCGSLEEDLFDEYTFDPVNQERINKILEKLSAYSNIQIILKGSHPDIGNACHILAVSRDAMPDQPKAVDINARLRVDSDVFDVQAQAAGSYADNFEARFLDILKFLAKRVKDMRRQ